MHATMFVLKENMITDKIGQQEGLSRKPFFHPRLGQIVYHDRASNFDSGSVRCAMMGYGQTWKSSLSSRS